MRFILRPQWPTREPTASVPCPSRTDGTPRFPPVPLPDPWRTVLLRRSGYPSDDRLHQGFAGGRTPGDPSCRMINTAPSTATDDVVSIAGMKNSWHASKLCTPRRGPWRQPQTAHEGERIENRGRGQDG